jgi:hypothetical protein
VNRARSEGMSDKILLELSSCLQCLQRGGGDPAISEAMLAAIPNPEGYALSLHRNYGHGGRGSMEVAVKGIAIIVGTSTKLPVFFGNANH